MRTLKFLIKNTIACVLYYSGIIRIISNRKLGGKLIVFMYHRVLTPKQKGSSFSHDGIVVDTTTFSKHMQCLISSFSPLSINQVTHHIENGEPFSQGNCLVTFDDGWVDNYENAFPILEQNNIPALIFLPTDYIGTENLFWQEQLANYIFDLCCQQNELYPVLEKHGLASLYGEQPDRVREQISHFLGALKQKSNSEIDAILQDFKNHYKNTGQPAPHSAVDKYINWEQAREMSAGDISFGSHAVSHRLLTKLSKEDLRKELTHSKELIESNLQQPVLSIAYPNGNYDDNVLKTTAEAGYKAAFTTESGYFSSTDNRHKIKRINIHQSATQNIPMFLCRILEIF